MGKIGNSPLEKFWIKQFRRASQPFADRVTFEWFDDLSFEEMLKRISTLPPHSAVFFVAVFVDAAGILQERAAVLPLPAGTIVRFRETGMWQKYRSQIALVAGIIWSRSG